MAPRLAFTSTMLEDYVKRAAEFKYCNGDDRAPAAFYTGWDYHSTGWVGARLLRRQNGITSPTSATASTRAR